MGVRRSVVLSSADRFFATSLKFATLIVTARLLAPEEIGVAVLGMAVLGIAGVIREFGGAPYLIQIDNPTAQRVQTVFTIQLLFTLPLALVCFLIAGVAADFYQSPGLRHFLYVTVACFLIGPFNSPIYALLSRRMAFGNIAFINIASTVTYTGTTISLAIAGHSFMSFAWGSLAQAIVGFLLSLIWAPKFPIFRINFHEWRSVCAFGAADSVRNLLYYFADYAPLMAFGRTLGAEAVGLYQRAFAISNMPTSTLLAGLTPVLLPAFANLARQKRALGESFVRSTELITAVVWPVSVWLVLLAHPIVLVLLGGVCVRVVPLVHIIAAAYAIWFPAYIVNPVLIAAGRVRDTLILAATTIPVVIILQSLASIWGLFAAALSLFLAMPFYVACAIIVVKRWAPFAWSELVAVFARSLGVSAFSSVGPLLIAFASGGFDSISIIGGFIGGGLGVIGWFIGLHVMRHPLLAEVQRLLTTAAQKLAALRRLAG